MLFKVSEKPLPCPRLEFRWTKKWDSWITRECVYSFVFPIREHDIRREDKDGEKVRSEYSVEIGRTEVSGGRGEPPVYEDNEFDSHVNTPFRDGAHAAWDAPYFGNPPIVAVCDDVWSYPQGGDGTKKE